MRSLRLAQRFEDDISQLLTQLGFSHERDFAPLGPEFASFLAIDMADPAAKVAVECDGPYHYLQGEGGKGTGRENGATAAKRR